MMSFVKWTFSPSNPVIKPGQVNPPFDVKIAGAGSVIHFDDEYLMYYWGAGKIGDCICAAKSSVKKPNEWKGLGPVVRIDPEDKDIAMGARWPWAVKTDDGRIFLYFLGRNRGKRNNLGPGGFLPFTFCLKISDDNGKTWGKTHKNILFPEKAYEKEGLGSCCVVQVAGKFYMYYTAVSLFETEAGKKQGQMGIGLAVSDNGIKWSKPVDDYVVAPRLFLVNPPEFKVAKPCVIKDGGVRRMWLSSFVGHSYRIYELISSDGIKWEWLPQSRKKGSMSFGNAGSFDSKQRCYSMVVKHGDKYRCWFTGDKFGGTGMGYAEGTTEKNKI